VQILLGERCSCGEAVWFGLSGYAGPWGRRVDSVWSLISVTPTPKVWAAARADNLIRGDGLSRVNDIECTCLTCVYHYGRLQSTDR